jgi:glycosyltransferase involved in cell wall biosynthesis
MMKVLALTRYAQLGASSRIRFLQYLPSLQATGMQVQMAPLFSDEYVRGLQSGRRSLLQMGAAYLQRLRTLLRARDFDLLWIEKETLPWLPAWCERLALPKGIPYVLDYDDAVFHSYDQHRSAWVRRLLGNKHLALMRNANLVVAGNDYLANFARAAGAPRVEVVPTVIDLARYPIPPIRAALPAPHLPTVGWIGQRSTAAFLRPLVPVFKQLAAQGQARFEAIGIDTVALGLPMHAVPWTEATEVASISRFDVGIMPLADEAFERGKCGYKLIQYMACGLPVVASPVGVNSQIVEHGVNGFLAETPAQWQEALQTLLADPGLRQRMGQAGRRKVEQRYCLQITGPLLASLLFEARNA